MTIEERAREWCNSIINRLDASDLYRGYVQGAVEERAEFREYLEKKKEKFKKERDILTGLDAKSMSIERLHYIDVLNEIINELFGGE